MGESFLIALREGFEAALVVAIVLAFVKRKAPEHTRTVWLGTGAALALSVAVGLALHWTIGGLEGEARLRTFAAICLAAAGLLTWMIFWMRKHARGLKAELEGRAGVALAEGSALTLAMVAFTAVAREGLETALFLISATTSSSGGDVVIGTLAGLALATVLGAAIYHGSRKIDMRRFFQVTGVLIIIFAAGLMAKFVLFLQGSGDIGSFNDAVYNLTNYDWLTQSTQTGRFLAGIFGWDPRPSIEQVVAYLGYLVPVVWLYFRPPAAPTPTPTPTPTAPRATPTTPAPAAG